MDELTLTALYAVWLALSTMPLGFMLGSSCSPCCGGSVGCEVSDGKPRTDPATEGTWTPSGTWGTFPGVTWTYSSTPSTTDGGTWFFYGSASTSKAGGGASVAEQQDWGNICNWYSNKTTSPSSVSNLGTVLDKRATRLPSSDAIVFIYGTVSTASSGPATVKLAYFYQSVLASGSTLETTGSAHNTVYGAAFAIVGLNQGTANGGALFTDDSANEGTVNDGAEFVGPASQNRATVNGGATFISNANNRGGTVNGSATFNEISFNAGTVNGSATFNDVAVNSAIGFFVTTLGVVNDGAVFNDNAVNDGTVNDGAEFNDAATNGSSGTVNGGATFNDAACSRRTIGSFSPAPCTRKFVAHPTDLPTCNGTANNGCVNSLDTCGCG